MVALTLQVSIRCEEDGIALHRGTYLVRIWRLDLADKPLGKFKTAPIGANKCRKSLDNMFLTK